MKLSILLLICPFFCLSQTGVEILKTSAEKIKSLNNIRYNIYNENAYQKITADVTIERTPNESLFGIGKIKLNGLSMDDQGSKQIQFSYDGVSFGFRDLKSNQITKLDSPTYRRVGMTGMMMYMMLALAPYWQKDPFGELFRQLVSADKLQDTIINSRPSYRVRVTIEVTSEIIGKERFESIWFIDKTNYLILGRDSKIEKQFLKILSVNTSLDKEYFNIAAGNEIKKISGDDPLVEGLLSVGTKAPDWILPLPDKKTIQLKELRGKIVLLDFWGTWCVPCLKAMPSIQAIHDQFKDRVEVLGISVEHDKAADPIGYMKRKGYTYTCLLNGAKITGDYKVHVFPSIYLIDKTGTIIHAEYGSGRQNFREDLINRIQKALEK